MTREELESLLNPKRRVGGKLPPPASHYINLGEAIQKVRVDDGHAIMPFFADPFVRKVYVH